LLKDIPLLGALFSSRGSEKGRTELMVVMRPTVLRDPEAASAHVAVEAERLPGIRAAVKELDKIEKGGLDREGTRIKPKEAKTNESSKKSDLKVEVRSGQEIKDPQDFNQVTPFTPEEEKLLTKPNED